MTKEDNLLGSYEANESKRVVSESFKQYVI